MRLFKSISVFLSLIVLFVASTAQAQLSRDPDAPVDITGDRFEAYEAEDFGIWQGDVQVVQAEAVLTAPTLKIYGIADGAIDRIEAEGGIRFTNDREAISGDRGLYNAENNTITITGNVVVVQGEQVMSGDELTYFTETGAIQFVSRGNNRVRGIFKTGGSSNDS